jgi:hypothetical protein
LLGFVLVLLFLVEDMMHQTYARFCQRGDTAEENLKRAGGRGHQPA